MELKEGYTRKVCSSLYCPQTAVGTTDRCARHQRRGGGRVPAPPTRVQRSWDARVLGRYTSVRGNLVVEVELEDRNTEIWVCRGGAMKRIK